MSVDSHLLHRVILDVRAHNVCQLCVNLYLQMLGLAVLRVLPFVQSTGFYYFPIPQDALDPDKGFIKDDSIILEVHVAAEAPHGVA